MGHQDDDTVAWIASEERTRLKTRHARRKVTHGLVTQNVRGMSTERDGLSARLTHFLQQGPGGRQAETHVEDHEIRAAQSAHSRHWGFDLSQPRGHLLHVERRARKERRGDHPVQFVWGNWNPQTGSE